MERGTNTQQEILTKMLGTIADLKLTADADLEWIVGLETMVLSKLREPLERANAMQQQMQSQPTGGSPMSMPPGMPPMGGGGMPGPAGPMIGGGGIPGMARAAGTPNPDELRRLLQQ